MKSSAGSEAVSSGKRPQRLAAGGRGPHAGDVRRRDEPAGVAEVVADVRRHRGNPLVVVVAHRDHHVRVGLAVDRSGQAVQDGLDDVVAMAVDARRSGQRRRHRRRRARASACRARPGHGRRSTARCRSLPPRSSSVLLLRRRAAAAAAPAAARRRRRIQHRRARRAARRAPGCSPSSP